MKKKRLGEVLRERGNVSAENLTRALQEQQGKLVHLGELLLQGGSVSKKDLIAALGEVTSVPYFDCSKVQVPADSGFDDQGGGAAKSKRHPYRATIGGNLNSVACRWNPSRIRANSEGFAEFSGIAGEDSLGHGYSRAAGAAGRPVPSKNRRSAARFKGLDAAYAIRRESGDAAAGIGCADARLREAGVPDSDSNRNEKDAGVAARNDSGNRADGIREKHHVVRVAESRTKTIDQYHHGGRSGGIRDTGIEPSAGKREGGSDVRDEPAVDSAARSGRNHDRRNPR